MRTLTIGDIHGGAKALDQILERANVDLSEDKLIFLGDYVDGWSETKQVLDKLCEIRQLTLGKSNEAVFILGNHDAWMLDFIKEGMKYPFSGWFSQGGKATLDSYDAVYHVLGVRDQTVIVDSIDIPRGHEQLLRDLVGYYIDDENRAYVHGGFKIYPLGSEGDLNYCWDREMWNGAIMGRDDACSQYKEVYIGHTSTCFWDVKPHYPEYNNPNQPKNGSIIVPMNRCNVWNMDTGGGWHGKLSIMDVDTKEVWQSDYVKELYPEDKGR